MAGLSAMPLVLAVNPQLPAASVDELIALAEAEPGRLRYASSGIGGSPHLAAVEFNTLAGTEMSHLPLDGSGPAVAAVIAGAADLLFDTTVAALPAVRDGRLRGLAVTSAARSPAAPDLPTLAEAGLPGLEMLSWNGLMVPAGTPAAEVERLHAAVVQAMAAAGSPGGTRLPGCRDPGDHARRVRHGPRRRYRGLGADRACGRPGGFGMIAAISHSGTGSAWAPSPWPSSCRRRPGPGRRPGRRRPVPAAQRRRHRRLSRRQGAVPRRRRPGGDRGLRGRDDPPPRPDPPRRPDSARLPDPQGQRPRAPLDLGGPAPGGRRARPRRHLARQARPTCARGSRPPARPCPRPACPPPPPRATSACSMPASA